MEDKDEEVVIGELMGVVEERRQRTRRSVGMRRTVKEAYVPLYRLKALYYNMWAEQCEQCEHDHLKRAVQRWWRC